METKNNIPIFGVAVPVGSTIKEMIRCKKYTQKEFAKEIGMQPSHLNELLNGKRRLTPKIAMQLERVLNIKAITWLNMQAQYDRNLLALQECNMQKTDDTNIKNRHLFQHKRRQTITHNSSIGKELAETVLVR